MKEIGFAVGDFSGTVREGETDEYRIFEREGFSIDEFIIVSDSIIMNPTVIYVADSYKAADHANDAAGSDTHTPYMSSWKPLNELPADYSLEQAIADSVYVNIHGFEIYNQVMADQFYADLYSGGGAAFLRMMQYTIEGDAILTDILYGNDLFTVSHDSTRDKFSSESDRAISTTTYRFLVIADHNRTGSASDSYFLSNEQNIYASATNSSELIPGLWPLPSPGAQSESPPQLEVALTENGASAQHIEAAQLTSNWFYLDFESGNRVGFQSDSPHALQLDRYDAITLNLTSASGECTLNFGDFPPSTPVSAKRWNAVHYMGNEFKEDSFNKSETIEVNRNTLHINNDGNDYIYEIYATWVQGSSYYSFRVNHQG
jgi:hypothetical protein